MSTVSQIVQAVADLVQTVTPGNGYTSNLSGKVFVYRRTPLTAKETLVVYIGHGAKSNPEGSEFGPRRRELPVEVDVIAKSASADSLVHNAIRDIETAVRADIRLGGLARFCTFGYSGHEIDQFEHKGAGQRIVINVTFTETPS